MKRIFVSALVGGLLLLASPVQAGTASCSVSPSVVARGATYTISLVGGPANAGVDLNPQLIVYVDYGTTTGIYGLDTDSSGSGSVSADVPTYAQTGNTRVSIVERPPGKQKVANCSFTITG